MEPHFEAARARGRMGETGVDPIEGDALALFRVDKRHSGIRNSRPVERSDHVGRVDDQLEQARERRRNRRRARRCGLGRGLRLSFGVVFRILERTCALRPQVRRRQKRKRTVRIDGRAQVQIPELDRTRLQARGQEGHRLDRHNRMRRPHDEGPFGITDFKIGCPQSKRAILKNKVAVLQGHGPVRADALGERGRDATAEALQADRTHAEPGVEQGPEHQNHTQKAELGIKGAPGQPPPHARGRRPWRGPGRHRRGWDHIRGQIGNSRRRSRAMGSGYA
jgi:hypothetical protein